MFIEFFQRIHDTYEYIVGAFMACVTVGTFLFKYWRRIKKARHERERKNTEMADKIHVIFSELKPNHGGSLKDKVNKIEFELNENTKATKETTSLVKEHTEMLKVLQSRQQWILDMQDTPIFENDSNGMCTWVNDAYANLVCRDKQELMGNGWRNFIHQDDRERVIDEWERAVREQRSSQSSFRMISRHNGRIYDVECYASKHKNNGYTGNLKMK